MFLSEPEWQAVLLSLKVSSLAVALSLPFGIFFSWLLVRRTFPGKALLDSILHLPLVLPPVVVGYLLLVAMGRRGFIGSWLYDWFGISFAFSWRGAVLAAAVMSFPLMVRAIRLALEGVDVKLEQAARTLGASRWRVFLTITLPLTLPGIIVGTVLAFARAMGEFGCTLFFAGNYAGITQTIPIAIYFEWMGGDTDAALFWVLVVIAFSFLVILFINLYTARSQAYRSRGYIKGRAVGDALHVGSRVQGVQDAAFLDDDEAAGGDALRIDRDALRELMRTDAAVGAAAGAAAGAVSTGRGSSSPSSATRDGKGGR